MWLTVPQAGSPWMFAVTLVQLLPPSWVTWTSPSLVPAQMSPAFTGDSAIAKTTPAYSTPMLSGVRPPEICWWLLSLRVRSGLITCQLLPASVVWWTYWLPTKIWFLSGGEMVSGNVPPKRYFRSAAGHPTVACGQTSTVRVVFVRRSYRVTSPPPLPEPDPLDQTMFGSPGSGVVQPLSPPPTVVQRPRGMPGVPSGLPNLLLLGPRVEGPSWRLP